MKTRNLLTGLIILFTLFSTHQILAQDNTFPEAGGGNAGIGTTNPVFELDVPLSTAKIRLGHGKSGPHGIMFGDPVANEGLNLFYRSYTNDLRVEKKSSAASLFSIDHDTEFAYFKNRVGLGTLAPEANLDVVSEYSPLIKLRTLNNGSTFGQLQIALASCNGCYSNQANPGDAVLRVQGAGQKMIFDTGSAGQNGESFLFVGAGDVIMTITDDKTVDVCGDVRAKEVRVESGWCDYVFDKEYNLPTLEEEAAFIANNGHLSDFESEEAMDGQINVGDVTKRQQETIEKLMLYVIELNEKVKQLETNSNKQ